MENGDGLVPLASRVERGAVPLGEGRRTVDSSGERARMQVRRRRYPSTKSKKSWAGAGNRDVVETRNHSCRGRASREVLGVMIITGTEKSPEDMARSMLLGAQQGLAGEPCLVLMMLMNRRHRRPSRGGLTDCCMMAHTPVAHQLCPPSQDKTEPATPDSHLHPFPFPPGILCWRSHHLPRPGLPALSPALPPSSYHLWTAGSQRTEALTVSKLLSAFQDLARRLVHICHRNE